MSEVRFAGDTDESEKMEEKIDIGKVLDELAVMVELYTIAIAPERA